MSTQQQLGNLTFAFREQSGTEVIETTCQSPVDGNATAVPAGIRRPQLPDLLHRRLYELLDQLQTLQDKGCLNFQGYYFSHPLRVDEFIDYLGIADIANVTDD